MLFTTKKTDRQKREWCLCVYYPSKMHTQKKIMQCIISRCHLACASKPSEIGEMGA